MECEALRRNAFIAGYIQCARDLDGVGSTIQLRRLAVLAWESYKAVIALALLRNRNLTGTTDV